MSFWEYVRSREEQLLLDSYMHASAVFQSMFWATLAAVVIAVLVYRSPRASNIAIAATSTILTIPSFALLGLLVPILGLGVAPTVTALVLYALLPIIRNTIVGLHGVDSAIIDAARGIGMSRVRVLLRVELPMAWPAILTGVRVSTQMVMGIAAIAAYVAGPGLGNQIFHGLQRIGSANALNAAIAGTVGVVILALLFDAAFVLIGRLTTSRGIRA